MTPLLANLEIPTEVISVLFLLLISLANWIKNRALEKKQAQEFEEEEEDPMRDVIWRRQMGEEYEEPEFEEMPPPMPARTIQVDPVREPVRQATPPPIRATVVSEKEAALATRFEKTTHLRKRRKTSHRSQIDRLLRSPSAAKDAILLTEILGPPVSLKSQNDH